MFKTQTIYQLTQATSAVLDRLTKGIGSHPFVECAPKAHRSSGFVPPLRGESSAILYETEGAVLFCLRTDEKTIPASNIKEAVDTMVAARKADGDDMSLVDIRVLKEELTDQALPNIPTDIKRRYGYIDKQQALLILDCAGEIADQYMDNLKKVLGGTPFILLGIEAEPCDKFTAWLKDPGVLSMFTSFKLGEDCSLKQPREGGTAVTNIKCDDLQSHGMEAMLEDGKVCCRIGLVHPDAGLAIRSDLGIRQFALSADQMINVSNDGDDIPALFANTVTVMRTVLGEMELALGGWPKQELLDLGNENG